MADIRERIDAWEAAGLIDAATAGRLRSAEAIPATEIPAGDHPAAEDALAIPSAAEAWFGPGVVIPEVFGYLGAGFLLAGWAAFVTRIAGDRTIVLAAGAFLAAFVLVALGAWLRTGDARRSRAAGVAFIAAVGAAGAGFGTLGTFVGIEGTLSWVVGAAGAGVLAVILRLFHPAVLTQVGLLGSLTSLALSLLALAETRLIPAQTYDEVGNPLPSGGPDPVLVALAMAAWWLAVAVGIGLIGLAESRAAGRGDPGAARRAAICRFWAGIVAVAGLWSAVTRSSYDASGEYHRAIEAWAGDLALLAVSAVLVERAFRRNTTAYLYPAALGLIVALSDINVTYLSAGTEVALLVEGLILLGVGYTADRIRRRIGATPSDTPTTRADASGGPTGDPGSPAITSP